MREAIDGLWKAVLLGAVFVVIFAGCISGKQPSDDQKKEIDVIRAELMALAEKNKATVAKYQDGTLTAAEFNAALAENTEAAKRLETKVETLQAQGVTAGDAIMYGALSGAASRTLLHGAVRVLPAVGALPGLGWLNFLAPLMTFFLQSESKKKPATT